MSREQNPSAENRGPFMGRDVAFCMAVGVLLVSACSSPATVNRADAAGTGGAGSGGTDAALDNPVDVSGDGASGGQPGKLPNGKPCTSAADCSSGFCVTESGQSFCCESACTGTCNTCTQTDSLGQCVPALSGSDPKAECPDDGLGTCGRNGSCNGKGACELYSAGTICKPGRCVGQTRTLPARCDGAGVCMAQTTSDCSPFKCGPGDQCLASCTADTDCAEGKLCLNGVCGKKADGTACVSSTECVHGNCQQGFCCATPCSGRCQSCGLPGSQGVCTPVPAGEDPLLQCADTKPESCGNNGNCDGKGACQKYPIGTICAAQQCVGNTKTLASRCDDGAMCQAGTQASCAPYRCGSSGDCLQSCSGDADCVAPSTCIGNLCARKLNGATCSTAAECSSNVCSQGVCCNLDCAGTCKSCVLPGTIGTCTNVPTNQDPLDQCQDSGAAGCGTDGTCNGAGGCKLYANGIVCKPSSCTGTTLKNAWRCDGNGTCVVGTTGSCDPFLCDSGAGACRQTCASDSDCTPGNSCIDNSCGKKPIGASCSTGAECASTFCAQGVCCQTTCTGTCRSCALTQSLGTCTLVPAGQPPSPASQCTDESGSNVCGTNGLCDGAGACQYNGNSTTCALAVCSGATYTPARTCDGTGSCKAVSNSSCAPYACNTASQTCKTTCGNDADCWSPNICLGGVCRKKPLGDACTLAAQCESGFCSQGRCCDSNCTSNCKSCAVAGAEGTCTFVPNDSDPLSQCPDDGVSTCGRDGMCDGAGACRLYVSGAVCVARRCVGATFTPARTCNGTGTCQLAASSACDPYACDATNNVCYLACTTAAECVSPNACVGNQCGKKADGQACSAAGECNSGFCAQGVCCHTACTGTCRSCGLQGTAGTCTNVQAGADPLDQCATEAASTCGTDGTCDGNGGCKRYAAGSICQASSCTGTTLTTARLCDGGGVCQASTTQSCGAYQCNSATGACKTSCTSSTADCSGSNVCNGGSCGPKPPGASCSAASECGSGFCSQGVCCDVDCSGTCKSCALAGTLGTCTPVPAGQTPTPSSQCAVQAPSTCGTDGTCDGAGACRKYAVSSVCVAASCAGSTLTPARTCSAAATCQTVSNVACDPYACGTGACKTTCSSDADCSAGNVCSNGQCGKPNGATCSAGAECATGNCVDGVCCSSTCTGLCRSCAVSGSMGVCTKYAAGSDPDSECPVDSASGCQRDGMCDGNGACRLYGASTVCATPSCTGTTLTSQRLCSGAGACQSGTNTACDPYACGSGACKTSCAGSADCSGTNVCIGGKCGKANGVSCSAGAECASSVCAQGVCCNAACSGTCRSCALSGSTGICSNVPTGADPLNQCTDSPPCGNDGFCDGNGACRYYGSGVSCAAATCADQQTVTSARSCTGGGACAAGTSTSCYPFACAAGACKITCTAAADCATGLTCIGGKCGKANGTACTAGSECASSNCADGVCCNSACAGTCMACNVSGSAGTCTAVATGTDPANECSAAVCNTTTATFTPKANCNGAGACTTPAGTVCANSYNCTAAGCKTTCAADADCVANYRCTGGACKKTNGQACSGGTQCWSGNCVDGVCCDTTCVGTCMACNISGSAGTCTGVPNGTDPATECAAAACNTTTATYTPKANCNGAGACTTPSPAVCGNNFNCTASGCRTTCSTSADCATNYACAGGTCKLANGQTCSAGTQCASGNCVDGVCCNTSCNTACLACNVSGSAGTCTAIASGTDPAAECAAASCNTTTATYTAKANCNGAGACTAPSGTVCANNYNCSAAGCKTTCTVDGDCAASYKCTGGVCKRANGQACTATSQCWSGNCVDGVCCNTACGGTCVACNLSGNVGTCSNIGAGTVSSDCSDNGAAGCGTNGRCDGAGACQLYASSQQCAAAVCADTTHVTAARNCSGSGVCSTGTTSSCGAYVCASGACKTSCASGTDCAPGFTCSGSACVTALKANGATCSAAGECASGNCVDGVCCDSACSGTCRSCAIAGNLGVCSNYTAGTVSAECTDNGAASCGTNGRCNGAGACQLYAGTEQCAAAACTDATHAAAARYCAGDGSSCPVATPVSCGAYVCAAGACKTTCASSADCASGYTCNGTTCVLPSNLKVQYRCNDPSAPANNWIYPHLRIVNTGSTALDLSTVRVRYWYTKEANAASQTQGQCAWASIVCPNNINTPTEVTVTRTYADRYVELTFSSGSVPVGSFNEIQWGFHKADWTNYTEAVGPATGADYSYDPTMTAFADWTKITAYQTTDGGATWPLAWGTEPQ